MSRDYISLSLESLNEASCLSIGVTVLLAPDPTLIAVVDIITLVRALEHKSNAPAKNYCKNFIRFWNLFCKSLFTYPMFHTDPNVTLYIKVQYFLYHTKHKSISVIARRLLKLHCATPPMVHRL